jgi:hypothetical protein
MPPRVEPILGADGRRLCGCCRERAVTAAYIRRRIYQCQSCHSARNKTAEARYRAGDKRKAASRRYLSTAKGRAVIERYDARRIRVADRYYGMAPTAEDAALIRQHIRRRLHEFQQMQRTKDA